MIKKKNVLVLGVAVIALAVIGAGVGFAKPTKPVKKYAQRALEGWKFDHKGHEVAAAKAGGARGKANCADCHQYKADGTINLKGGKEHGTRCVKCHAETTTKCKVDGKNTQLRCQSCHTFTPDDPCFESTPKALSKPRTQQSAFSHGQHLGFGVAIEKNCANCHRDKAPAGAAAFQAHQSCFGCHGEKGKPATVSTKLFWNNCEGCHGAGKPKPPASGDPFRLGSFDHQRHHRDSKQASCSTCHSKMTGTDPTSVPRPSMESCLKSCHDGSRQAGKAFSAVGTKCTTCHQNTGAALTMPVTKGVAFSHDAHAKRNTKIEGHCGDCHSVAADGTVLAPNTGKDHMPCANAGCHQTEFMSRTTKICFVCHETSPVPWQKLQARMQDPAPKNEFFENISHASHLQKKGTTNAACTDCHGDKLGGGKAPKDHQACAECHGKGPPAHSMNDCDKCHNRNPVARPQISEWSVAATFDHKRHANDSTTRKTTDCISCHAEIGKSASLATMAKPKMEGCARCHNGKVSFKTTGFDCAKCHVKPGHNAPPTTSGLMNAGSGPTAMLDPADPRTGTVADTSGFSNSRYQKFAAFVRSNPDTNAMGHR